MPRAKWSEEQIIGILKQVEAGRMVVEVCRENGVGENGVGESTYYKWKSKYGGLEVNEARRLKSLEDENTKLPLKCEHVLRLSVARSVAKFL